MLIHNRGLGRVIDVIRLHRKSGHQLGCITPAFSPFAYAELREALDFLGREGDRAARNRLQSRWLANRSAKWLDGILAHNGVADVRSL